MSVTLSIVVPTKNRYNYLEKLMDLFVTLHLGDDVELVIQDNSDDNYSFVEVMNRFERYSYIRYFHYSGHLSVCENCDMAILHSSGEYVCMIGDDDGFTRNILECVNLMKENAIDSLIANKPAYKWPDVHGVVFDFSGTVRIEKYTNELQYISLKQEIKKVVKNGALGLGKLPCVYHGIVKRTVLNQVFTKTGSFFPGPSPDMANAIAVGLCATKHVYYDTPVIISGHGAKSAGGMGARHEHNNEIKNLSFLPQNTDKLWEERIPKYWTGETIYAESAIKSLKRMGANTLILKFNYSCLYGAFIIFHLSQYHLAYRLMRFIDFLYFPYYACKSFVVRLQALLRNYMLKKGWNKKMYLIGSLNSIIECEECISKLRK